MIRSLRRLSACGPNLRSLAVYLLVFQHIPVARTQALISDLTGARPSTGWISSQLCTIAEMVVDVEKLIKSLIVAEQVIHVDETTATSTAPGAGFTSGLPWRNRDWSTSRTGGRVRRPSRCGA